MRANQAIGVLAGIFVGGLGAGVSPVRATEEHLLSVYQALATSPSIDLAKVNFVTWFGAEEETTMEAMSWPARLSSPHHQEESPDLNWASLLGVHLRLQHLKNDGWDLTLDLREMKPLPEALGRERLGEDAGRPWILERFLEAAQMNLRVLGIFDCPLTVVGSEVHADFEGVDWKAVLNPLEEAWGPWNYRHLPRKFPEGDLAWLAAQSLEKTSALATVFMIISGEQFAPEARVECGSLLMELLRRVGDESFGRTLSGVEGEVRLRVGEVLRLGAAAAHDSDRGIQGAVWFPRTWAAFASDS